MKNIIGSIKVWKPPTKINLKDKNLSEKKFFKNFSSFFNSDI